MIDFLAKNSEQKSPKNILGLDLGPDLVQGGPLQVEPRVSSTDTDTKYKPSADLFLKIPNFFYLT